MRKGSGVVEKREREKTRVLLDGELYMQAGSLGVVVLS
jgi:hypothetical protein